MNQWLGFAGAAVLVVAGALMNAPQPPPEVAPEPEVVAAPAVIGQPVQEAPPPQAAPRQGG